MQPQSLVTLTKTRLNKARTARGAFTNAQIAVFFDDEVIGNPMPSGWLSTVEGRQVPLSDFITFVELGCNLDYIDKINNSGYITGYTLIPKVEGFSKLKTLSQNIKRLEETRGNSGNLRDLAEAHWGLKIS
ncbi:hypothetical protein GLP21_12360 [Photobacterium carnosum]|uniref:Uncharacterized protein n=1 Tax=Photobacterium carnosum TaxID=2023717 RepID=A0A2N4UW89_9GAMM|nr:MULTISPECIES: hypothetical protein [Photobacterium]MCD9475859.1 hypothetical protein [Photobacterium phosphoreum]MCD9507721.1 hypothetical protein [Photobacterium phosphoreum]MCD9538158.1 hypothetical protein [Photobacterium carnosum]MCD9542555.1 hypothetical protein [Photobacterium carnosum]MCD9545941.1 hypothetical protein [Photobacterium carnosum]